MAKNDQEEAFDRVLTGALARTVDFLKFAEAKNAALLTFCSAWILGSVGLLASKSPLPMDYDGAFTTAIPIFGVAAVSCIWSFLPQLDPAAFTRRPQISKNLLFFGHLAAVPAENAAAQLREAYLPEEGRSVSDAYLSDLSAQLAINSQIALRKYRFFNLAAMLTLLAVTVLIAPAAGWSAGMIIGALCR